MLLVVGVLVALMIGGLAWATDRSVPGSAAAAQTRAAEPLAKLRVIDPGADVRRDAATNFRAARDGQNLRQGDTVRTNDTGFVEINYADGSLTRLGHATEFTIELLTEERGGRQTRGALTVGDTWSRAAKVSESGSFEVRAGGTTAAVEGTAFSFSCVPSANAAPVCTVVDVVDNVNVTTTDGSLRALSPATSVQSTDDALGPITTLTREQLLANGFIIDNLLLDQAQGKGLGLGDLPAASVAPPTTTTTTVAGISIQAVAPAVTTVEAPPDVPETPPLPPPPSDPRCVSDAWTALVGAGGQTFATEQACSDFGLAGGTFATTGAGVFIIPLGETVTLGAVSNTACHALSYGYELNLDASTALPVGSKSDECPGATPISLGEGFTLGPFDHAVLVRVFLQDDTCGGASMRFFSDGDHAALDPADPSAVWLMDAGGLCTDIGARPPDPDDLNLIISLLVS